MTRLASVVLVVLVVLEAALLAGTETWARQTKPVQEVKRFPWDSRTSRCFSSVEAQQTYPCRAPEDWPDYAATKRRIETLLIDTDFDLLERAASEVAYSQQQFASGRYRFEAWILAMQVSFQYQPERGALVERWEAAKGSDGMVAVAKAFMQVGQAWLARGSGYANTVSPEAWELYHQKLEEANATLDSAAPRVKDSGPWHYLKLHISFQHPKLRSTSRSLLARAIDRWPDSVSIYSVPLDFAEPKWGGSFDQMDAIARLAVEKSRNKWGDALYAVLYEESFRGNQAYTLKDSAVDWDLMKRGFRDLESRHGGQKWIWRNFAALACQMRDREEARRLFDLFDSLNATGLRDDTAACRKFAYGN